MVDYKKKESFPASNLYENRRAFLKTTAILAGGLLLNPPTAIANILGTVSEVNANFTASVTGSTVTLNWNDVSGVVGFKLHWGNSAGNLENSVDIGYRTSLQAQDVPDNIYYMAVEAYDSNGEIGRSNEISFTVFSSLSTPSDFKANVSSSGAVTLSWTGIPGANGYKLYWGNSAGNLSNSVDVGNRTLLIDGAVPDNTYYMAVVSYNSIGTSARSNEVSFTVSSSLSVPSNFKADVSSSGAVTLSWTGIPGASGYKLYWGNSPGNLSNSVDVGNRTFLIAGDVPESAYFMAVLSYKDGVESDLSDVVSFTVSLGLAAPSGASSNVNGSTVYLNWRAVSGANGYKIYWGTSPGNLSNSVDIGNRTSLVAENVPNNTYYMAFTAYNRNNESGLSDEINFSVA